MLANGVRRWAGIAVIAGIGVGALTRLASAVQIARGATGNTQLLFVASSAVALIGLVVLVRADRSVWTRGLTEAATLTAGAFGLLMWVGVVRPYVAQAALDTGTRQLAEVSLFADLALAVLLVCVASRRPTRSRVSVAMLLGGACHVVTDVVFVVVSAQHGGQMTVGRLTAVLAAYVGVGVIVCRTSDGAAAVDTEHEPAVFNPLVGVVVVNSVTVVLAGVHEDRIGTLMVAAAALMLTAVAARAQWKLNAANESMLRAAETDRNWLRHEHVALEASHAVTNETLHSTSEFLEAMTTRVAGPLNGVLEATDRLDDPELNRSAGILLEVMNELLGVTTDATSTPEFVANTFSLRAALDNALSPFTEAAASKLVAFDVVVDAHVPEMVHADEARFTELLGIFAANAVRHTAKGNVTATVSFVEVRDGDEFILYVEFTDTGAGMSSYDCYRAFEFDVRAEPHLRRYRGKVRGLTRARLLIEGFGGLFGVESELGRGATFWFTAGLRAVDHETDRAVESLPAPPPDPEVFVPEVSAVPESEPQPEPEHDVSDAAMTMDPEVATRSGCILFAEDDPLCRRMTVAALRRAGYRVDTVTTGLEAVQAVVERRYDLVLMDVQLPVMNGLEAARAVRVGVRNSDVPIIAVSAFATEKEQSAALEAGMDAFVKKPLDVDSLLVALDRWMIQHVSA